MRTCLTFLQLEALREAASKVDDINNMFQIIRNVNLFSKLDEATQKSLCGSLTYEAYAPKQVVFHYRDYGDKYYLILTGRVSVQVPVTPNSDTFQQVAILESGSGFGEMALMENKPRAATVVCLEATGTLGCADMDVKALAEKLKEHNYPGPQIILRQGEEANQVILVESGTVLALRSLKVDAKKNLITKKREKRSSQILDGEKTACVAERGNVYGVTLVAFPAAQVFSIDKRQFLKSLTEEMKRSIDLASGPLPDDSELLHQYLQAVKWDAYKRSLFDEIRLRHR
ncbi:hypothetical protein BESB_051780 [Besnoitia besnoiti]|uniref:Cyclic nucleotide-binding domain-containing protein n=1 Tax=Besnoitia besnoiti TaxID=94643 RepID=A0A2A9MIV8_BESBE|nr:hypothetical protein BESB_051780 [Besnoitia besnoiti]PFH35527.1 hypothetical protein BESB_051780 [Besnoitia besnoiti]